MASLAVGARGEDSGLNTEGETRVFNSSSLYALGARLQRRRVLSLPLSLFLSLWQQ